MLDMTLTQAWTWATGQLVISGLRSEKGLKQRIRKLKARRKKLESEFKLPPGV